MGSRGADGPAAQVVFEGPMVDVSLDVGASKSISLGITNHGSRSVRGAIGSTDDWLQPASDALEVESESTSSLELEVECHSEPVVRHGWVTFAMASVEQAAQIRVACVASEQAMLVSSEVEGSHAEPLTWEPPRLHQPEVVRVSPAETTRIIELDRERDFLVILPDVPVERGLVIDGGRNVVMIGGEIRIPWQGRDPSIAARRGLFIVRSTGVVHVEGILMQGEDISEGIQIAAPLATVQIQNVAVLGIHARDQEDFSDNHPDIIQTFGNVARLRVDGLTGSTDYQGLFLSADYGGRDHGSVDLRRVNIVGDPTARYLFWVRPREGSEPVRLDQVWLDVPPERQGGLRRAVWPDAAGSAPNRALIERGADGIETASWPQDMRPQVVGVVKRGVPPGGDFVEAEHVGTEYRSPGYTPTPSR